MVSACPRFLVQSRFCVVGFVRVAANRQAVIAGSTACLLPGIDHMNCPKTRELIRKPTRQVGIRTSVLRSQCITERARYEAKGTGSRTAMHHLPFTIYHLPSTIYYQLTTINQLLSTLNPCEATWNHCHSLQPWRQKPGSS